MATKIQSKTVTVDGQEQTIIVIIPDANLKEALEAWATHGTCHSISNEHVSDPVHRVALAAFLDDLDETVNPEGYGFEEEKEEMFV